MGLMFNINGQKSIITLFSALNFAAAIPKHSIVHYVIPISMFIYQYMCRSSTPAADRAFSALYAPSIGIDLYGNTEE